MNSTDCLVLGAPAAGLLASGRRDGAVHLDRRCHRGRLRQMVENHSGRV